MAFVIDAKTLQDKEAQEMYMRAFLGSPALETWTPVLNFKQDGIVPNMGISGAILQTGGSCTWNPSGDVDLNGADVQMTSFKINLELCPDDLIGTYWAKFMRPGANNDDLPEELSVFILQEIMDRTAEEIEQIAWMGGTVAAYPYGLANGVYPDLLADPLTLKVPHPGVVNSGNVMALLEDVYDQIPAAILRKSDVVIWVDTVVGKAYRQALAAAHPFFAWQVEGSPMNYQGLRMVETHGLLDPSTNKAHIVVGRQSQFYIVSDLLTDTEDLRVIKDVDNGDDLIKIKGKFRLDFVYNGPSQIVITQ